MAGEIIQAQTTEEAEKQLAEIYKAKSINFREITHDEYEAYKDSEHEDSDNHINLDRVGKDSRIVDLAYYKYIGNRETAYRIDLINPEHKVKKQMYFVILPREDQ